MQQRGTSLTNMEAECDDKALQGRGRSLSKLKVLVRSHAMREETSPPREPTPTNLVSPCIKLTPSPADSPNSNSLLVVSPSISRRNSPARSSPSSTIVPSPTRCSPNNDIENPNQPECIEGEPNTKYLNNNKMNRQNLEKSRSNESIGKAHRTEIIVEETSHEDNRKGKHDKCLCESTNQNCVKCAKVVDKNVNNNYNVNNNNSNTLTVNRVNLRGKFRHQSSSQGSFEGSSSNSPCLSRDSSSEQYTDTTGVDLELFIPETLNRNAKDRAIMLRIEQELVNLAKDKTKSYYKFPPMSSYQRMLVHRCAAYFGMDHNIESSGKCVVVNKTKNTRIPEVQFKQHIKSDIVFSDEPRRSILKRDSNSTEDYSFKSPDRQHSFENRRSKSFEEREEEYEKVRRRIFSVEMQYNSSDDLVWSDMPWSSVESDNSGRLRLPPPNQPLRGGRLLKVQSEEVGEETLRPCVAKSYSFGGYGGSGVSVLTRGDSVISTRSEGARLFNKQDSAASSVSWRLSPSSSGYKTQSQRSESVTPSPTSTPYLSGQDSTNSMATNTSDHQITQVEESSDNQVVWAVTDIQSVPKGSIIINPQTGQPVKNVDGTIYHYDPRNPPPGLNNSNIASKPPPSPQKSYSPNKTKDRSISPKKKVVRSSPVKKSITNSSTSPSLPFTPSSPLNRTFSYIPTNEAIPNVPVQAQYPIYGNSYGPTAEGPVSMYQQPYIVYAPYSVPVPYEGRNEPQMSEMPGYYVNIPTEAPPVNPAVQPITYQPQHLWNQQPVYYSNVTPNPSQRFSVPVPNHSGSYLPTTYPTNFVPPHSQNIPVVPQPPQTPEVVSVYSQQPIHVVYPTNTAQPNGMVYPNQGVVCNTQMYAPLYPTQTLSYPQSTSTPNSCTSSVSNTAFCGQLPDMNTAQTAPPIPNYSHLVQNMSQMSLNASSPMQPYNQGSKVLVQNINFDGRSQKASPPKGNKFSNPRGFVLNSSQSSTGTNSPATTVVAGYCNNQTPNMYRTPPPTDTAALQHCYGANYGQSVMLRQSNIHSSPPNTNRNSRSPTPGSDVLQMGDMKQRLPLTAVPHVYQGMPYMLHSDTRIVTGKGQPNPYRQQFKQQNYQNSDNKMHKNRKNRGNKMTNVQQPNTKL